MVKGNPVETIEYRSFCQITIPSSGFFTNLNGVTIIMAHSLITLPTLQILSVLVVQHTYVYSARNTTKIVKIQDFN